VIPLGVVPVVPRIDEAASAEAANVAAQSSAAPAAAIPPATRLNEPPATKLIIRFLSIQNHVGLSTASELTRVAAPPALLKKFEVQSTDLDQEKPQLSHAGSGCGR
jgi:hypothetical protein